MFPTAYQIPGWSLPLFRYGHLYRYIAIHGGRGSSKTSMVARYIIRRCREGGKPFRVIVARDYARYLPESAMEALQIAIRTWLPDKADEWETRGGVIHHLPSGSRIMFAGLELIGESFKGWEEVDLLWIEEAQTLKRRTWNIIYPTVRAPKSQIVLTWNPRERSELAWQRFVLHDDPYALVLKVNYYDNPWLPDVLRSDIEFDKEFNPNYYNHIWLGEPDDSSGTKILPYSTLLKCVDGYIKYGAHRYTPIDCGLDIADGGADRNALVTRAGPCVEHREEWASEMAGHLRPTAVKAAFTAMDHNAWMLYYDRTGVGSPILGHFHELDYFKTPVFGVSFGEKPGGPDQPYELYPFRTNEETFAKRNAQLAFALRIRATHTMSLMEGDDGVSPDDCLFINPKIWRLEEYLAEMSRPDYRIGTTGKIEIDKRVTRTTDDGQRVVGYEKSPDSFDGTSLAFARDSQDTGLRADL